MPEDDGALSVHFRAGGMLEMCWHLFTWGTAVTVVAPVGLRTTMTELTAAILDHHRRDSPTSTPPRTGA